MLGEGGGEEAELELEAKLTPLGDTMGVDNPRNVTLLFTALFDSLTV